MATQYTPILQLALPVTGELNGTWGDVVNDNITSMVEEAIAGLATISTWTANSHTLTTADGVTDEARCAMLVATTGSGGTALSAAGEIICPARTKLFVLQNNAAYQVTLKTASGSGVAVAAGETAFLFCDGTNVNACVTTIVNGHITGNLTVDGNATVNGNTTLGNATSDTVTVTGTVTSNLIFTDNTYDIGASGATRPRNLFLSGNATVGGNTTLGDATSDTVTVTARVASDLNPSADNTYDLGTAGNSWRNLYIDGTATIATLNVTTIDTTNLEVTNIKAKDGTAAITLADSTGVATLSANPILSAGTANGVAYLNGSKVLTTGSALTFDGNTLGVGATTNTWAGNWKAIQFGAAGAIGSRSDNYATVLGFNWYENSSSVDSFIGSNYASVYKQSSGQHQWLISTASGTAGNAITFTQAMTLDASGNLGVGTSSPQGSRLCSIGSSSRAALFVGGSNPDSTNATVCGLTVTNSRDSSSGVHYVVPIVGSNIDSVTDASTNLPQMAGAVGGWDGAAAIAFDQNLGSLRFHTVDGGTAGTDLPERMRIDSSGNVGIGTSSPTNYGAAYKTLAVNGDSAGGGVFDLMVNGTRTGTFYAVASEVAYGSITNVPVTFRTNNTERMRLDSSGNLGLGVTPSAWGANYKTLDIGFGSALTNPYSYTATWLSTNAYHNGTNFIYKNSAQATYYAQAAGAHYWSTAPSGTAGDAITFTKTLGITAGGVLNVGNTADLDIIGLGSSITAIQLANAEIKYGGSTNLDIFNNCYYGGSPGAVRYSVTGAYAQDLNFDVGGMTFSATASTGTKDAVASLTQRFSINNTGNAILGTGSPVSLGAGTLGLTLNGTTNGGFTNYQYNGTSIGYFSAGASSVYINTFSGKGIDIGTAGTNYTINLDASNYVGIGLSTQSSYSVNGVTNKLCVNGNVNVLNGSIQTRLNRFGHNIMETSASTLWIKLGNFAAGQAGIICSIRIFAHTGFNSDTAQNAYTEVYFKTANGSSGQPGGGGGTFYGDGFAEKMLGTAAAPSALRVVQNNTASYDIWGLFGNYTANSFFEVTTSNGSSFIVDGGTSQASAPTYNTYIDLTVLTNTYTSDEKFKEVLGNFTNGLDVVNSIDPIIYKWKKDFAAGGFMEDAENRATRLGFRAGDVEKQLPEIVEHGKINIQGDTDVKSLRIEEMIPVLWSAVQELSAENKQLLKRLEVIEGKQQ